MTDERPKVAIGTALNAAKPQLDTARLHLRGHWRNSHLCCAAHLGGDAGVAESLFAPHPQRQHAKN
jgi:hypothetical protein